MPGGRRVVIVTNGGGPGILAADACEHHGLVLPEFSQETIGQLNSVAKRDIAFNNPLDMTAGAAEDEFEGVLRVLAADPANDAVITIFIPPTVVDPKGIEEAIRRVAPVFQRRQKPLMACFMGQQGVSTKLGVRGKFVPCYLFPEDAVAALAEAAEYGEWRRKPKGTVPKIRGIRRERARKLVESAMTRNTRRPFWLSAGQIADLLNCYGIRLAKTLMVNTASEATAAASEVGFPAAVKLASSTIVHKTDVGGVKLDLRTQAEVEKAFEDIKATLSEMGRMDEMDGVTVQRMVSGGVEAIVGVTQDPSFGPLIMFGLGGIYAELMKDIAVRLHPLTDLDAEELVSSIKMAKLFEGFRGSPPTDTAALEDLLLRLSAMIEDIPQIAELDFNPVKVLERGQGYWVVDARIMVR
jgi:acyl-CoA synthetase (NDP forming)